jgi:phenylalanyl-tRNA synthetase beta chain
VKFSRNWLADYVELPGVVGELADRLTAAGFAVEGIEEAGGDVVLDVDVTTNRPDAMCHFGLAREIAVLFDRPLSPPPVGGVESAERSEEAIAVRLDDDDCPRYVARVVRGVEVGPSPAWLARRIEAIGHRPHNNVVDVTNFVLWETGQPIHAFDLGRLPGGLIVVRSARAREDLVTLDGVDRRLDPDVLVIADAERAVALAGVMGGRDTEVSGSTRDILIESAHFRPSRVRRGAGRLGLHTDASHRFERGTDAEGCRLAADRVAYLLAEVAGGSVSAGAVDVRRGELPVLFGYVDPAALSRFAGVEIGAETVEHALSGLGFAPHPLDDGGGFRATVPSWRHYDFAAGRGREDDGVRVWEADLYEEVMRIVGFDAVPSALPALGAPDEGASAEHRLREGIRAHLTSCGLAEAINYAFHDEASHGRFEGLLADAPPLRLANPLSEALAVLRRSLLPGLVESARFNARRGAPSVGLFEIGRLFAPGGGEEIEGVAIVVGGAPAEPWQRASEPDLFDLKGFFESLGRRFGVELEAESGEASGLLPGTTLRWRSIGGLVGKDATVGYLGQVEDRDFPFPLYAGEMATAALSGRRADERALELPSRYPGVAVDLTLTHATNASWRELAAAIEERRHEHLTAFGLKDRYRGEGVPEGAVNTTIYFLYNATDRSLTREEVNADHESLRAELESRFGWRK